MILDKDLTPEALANFIEIARKGNKRILIRGYTSSDGAVSDVTLIPSDGGLYGRLLDESRVVLEKMSATTTGTMKQACEEQLASVIKSQQGGEGKKASELRELSTNVSVKPSEPGMAVLLNCELHSRTSDAESTPTKHKNELTAIKASLRKSLPTGRFAGTYNLKPGKFTSIELV